MFFSMDLHVEEGLSKALILSAGEWGSYKKL